MPNIRDIIAGIFREEASPGFKALGQGYWIASFTNNFQDSHGEILTAKAHDRYVRRVKLGLVPMPELWHWHKEGTRHGEALWLDRVGDHLVVAVGKFDDTPAGKAAEAYYLKHKGEYVNSHGFLSPPWAILPDGTIEDYVTFEITTLPRGKEANRFTSFEEVLAMAVTKEVEQSINAVFGDAAPEILKQIKALDAQAEDTRATGVKFKAFADPGDSGAAPVVPAVQGEFLQWIVKSQADQAAALQLLTKAMEKVVENQTPTTGALQKELDKITEIRKTLEKELELVPARVQKALDDAGDDEDDEDEDEDTILDLINKAKEAGDWDPAFPGLQVPKGAVK